MNVKRSVSRFFMYEEQGQSKLIDNNGPTQIIQRSPKELGALLHEQPVEDSIRYHYWTSPFLDVAPGLLNQVKGYDKIHPNLADSRLLDPRGPSLWMGSAGSATQAHYDIADNVIVQLFGTKRIRCYSPRAASALHVFPDAHPRARKSQVNFDNQDEILFPNFLSLPPPEIDVRLQPGDAIFIPAFWFHHVENGMLPSINHTSSYSDYVPSVSLNVFALSMRMRIAQNILMSASQPFGRINPDFDFAVEALHLLSLKLFQELNLCSNSSDFIRDQLLDARYAPLKSNAGTNRDINGTGNINKLSNSEKNNISSCITRLLPQLASLQEEGDDGVLELVICHLFELWAVELVGAPSVAKVWESALLRGGA